MMNNQKILSKFENLTTETILYHKICKDLYYGKIQTTNEPSQTTWHTTRKYHKAAYELYFFIEENIISNRKCYLLSYLYNYYMCSLQRIAEENSDSYDKTFTAQHLKTKIMITYGKNIKTLYA